MAATRKSAVNSAKAWATLRGRFERAADDHPPLCHLLMFASVAEQSILHEARTPPLVAPPEGEKGLWVQAPDGPWCHRVVGVAYHGVANRGAGGTAPLCYAGRFYWNGHPPERADSEPTKALARWSDLAADASALLDAGFASGAVAPPFDPLIDPAGATSFGDERWVLALHALAADAGHPPLRADRMFASPDGFHSLGSGSPSRGAWSFLHPGVFLASVYAIDALTEGRASSPSSEAGVEVLELWQLRGAVDGGPAFIISQEEHLTASQRQSILDVLAERKLVPPNFAVSWFDPDTATEFDRAMGKQATRDSIGPLFEVDLDVFGADEPSAARIQTAVREMGAAIHRDRTRFDMSMWSREQSAQYLQQRLGAAGPSSAGPASGSQKKGGQRTPVVAPGLPIADQDVREFAHAEDFAWIIWCGQRFTFKKGNQAESIKQLWAAWEKSGKRDGCGLGEETIGARIESANSAFRLAHVFREHPAWGTVIQSSGRGQFALFRLESPKNHTS